MKLEILGLKIPLAGFALGVILLTMGRRLFWLFVGVVGFIVGFDFVRQMLPRQPYNEAIIIALAIGLMGALLAVSLQKIAIAAGGFLAGWRLLPKLLSTFGIAVHQHHLAILVAGGIIGAVLMSMAFDFALTVLSSLLGADLILQALGLAGRVYSVLFVLLSALGFALQYGLIRSKPSRSKTQR